MNFNIFFIIKQFVNEIIYNFKFNQFLNLIIIFISELKSFAIRIKIVDVLIFININAKYDYDKHYKVMFFKKENFALLRLHENYNIFINVIIIRKLE